MDRYKDGLILFDSPPTHYLTPAVADAVLAIWRRCELQADEFGELDDGVACGWGICDGLSGYFAEPQVILPGYRNGWRLGAWLRVVHS